MKIKYFSKITVFGALLPCALQANFTGFYGGVQTGFQSGKAKISSTYNQALDPLSNTEHVSRLSLEGLNAGLQFGYGRHLQNNVYLGAELSGRLQTTSHQENRVITQDPKKQKIQVKSNNSIDFSIKAGFVHQSFLPYVKLGVELSHYKIDFEAVEANFAGGSVSKTLIGFRPAVGFEYMFHPNWLFGFEYAHTFFEGISQVQAGVLGSRDATHHIRPNTGVVMARVSYKI